jgi:hypothetical protein
MNVNVFKTQSCSLKGGSTHLRESFCEYLRSISSRQLYGPLLGTYSLLDSACSLKQLVTAQITRFLVFSIVITSVSAGPLCAHNTVSFLTLKQDTPVKYRCNGNLTPWPESASVLYWLSYRRLSAKLVPTFADRRCQVVSVTDPYDRILGFLDLSRYFFLSSSSKIVLTRLSVPRSRPITSQKVW